MRKLHPEVAKTVRKLGSFANPWNDPLRGAAPTPKNDPNDPIRSDGWEGQPGTLTKGWLEYCREHKIPFDQAIVKMANYLSGSKLRPKPDPELGFRTRVYPNLERALVYADSAREYYRLDNPPNDNAGNYDWGSVEGQFWDSVFTHLVAIAHESKTYTGNFAMRNEVRGLRNNGTTGWVAQIPNSPLKKVYDPLAETFVKVRCETQTPSPTQPKSPIGGQPQRNRLPQGITTKMLTDNPILMALYLARKTKWHSAGFISMDRWVLGKCFMCGSRAAGKGYVSYRDSNVKTCLCSKCLHIPDSEVPHPTLMDDIGLGSKQSPQTADFTPKEHQYDGFRYDPNAVVRVSIPADNTEALKRMVENRKKR